MAQPSTVYRFPLAGALFHISHNQDVPSYGSGGAIKKIVTITLFLPEAETKISCFNANDRRLKLAPMQGAQEIEVDLEQLSTDELTSLKIQDVIYALNQTGKTETECWRTGEIRLPPAIVHSLPKAKAEALQAAIRENEIAAALEAADAAARAQRFLTIKQKGAVFYTQYEEKRGAFWSTVKVAPTLEINSLTKFMGDDRVKILPDGLLQIDLTKLTDEDKAKGMVHGVEYALYNTGKMETEDWRKGNIKFR